MPVLVLTSSLRDGLAHSHRVSQCSDRNDALLTLDGATDKPRVNGVSSQWCLVSESMVSRVTMTCFATRALIAKSLCQNLVIAMKKLIVKGEVEQPSTTKLVVLHAFCDRS